MQGHLAAAARHWTVSSSSGVVFGGGDGTFGVASEATEKGRVVLYYGMLVNELISRSVAICRAWPADCHLLNIVMKLP
jgi:hypothetical protein